MKKILSSILAFIIVLFSFTMYSNAAGSTVELNCSPSTVTVGNQFDVTFSVKSLGSFTGLYGAAAVLTYDSTYVSYVSISSKGSWSTPTYNKNNGKISILSDSPQSAGNVFSIKFKLIAKPSTTTKLVTLSTVSITDNNDEDEFTDSLSITIVANDPAPVNNTVNNIVNNTVNNTVNNVVNNTVNNTIVNNTVINTVNNTINNTTNNTVIFNTSNSSNNQNKSDDSTSNQKIPYAGFNTFIIVSILVLIVSGIYAYYRYRRLNI